MQLRHVHLVEVNLSAHLDFDIVLIRLIDEALDLDVAAAAIKGLEVLALHRRVIHGVRVRLRLVLSHILPSLLR